MYLQAASPDGSLLVVQDRRTMQRLPAASEQPPPARSPLRCADPCSSRKSARGARQGCRLNPKPYINLQPQETLKQNKIVQAQI